MSDLISAHTGLSALYSVASLLQAAIASACVRARLPSAQLPVHPGTLANTVCGVEYIPIIAWLLCRG